LAWFSEGNASGARGDFLIARFGALVAFWKLWRASGGWERVFHPTRFPFRLRVLLLLLVFASALRADFSLDQARRAQALLGPDIWSQIVRVENEARSSRYPRRLHALVFELAGILWFYTPADGTQSFSLHAGRLAEEKADFGPLLRDIEPGFKRWSVVPRERWPKVIPSLALQNGCLIESVAALRDRLARGEPMERPRLLSYYAKAPDGTKGHTVLAFGAGEQVEVVDPGQPGAQLRFAKSFSADPLALARAVEGPAVCKARYVTLDPAPLAPDNVLLAADPRGSGAGAVPDRS